MLFVFMFSWGAKQKLKKNWTNKLRYYAMHFMSNLPFPWAANHFIWRGFKRKLAYIRLEKSNEKNAWLMDKFLFLSHWPINFYAVFDV